MNPYYATPPQQSQPPPPQRPQVDLDDLFGGPSSPTPWVSANNGSSVRSDGAFAAAPPPPPPPSYDALGGSGYGVPAAAAPQQVAYAAPSQPPPQPGHYGSPVQQGYAPPASPYGAASSAPVATPPQPQPQPQPQTQQPQQPQQPQHYYNGGGGAASAAVQRGPPLASQVYLPPQQPQPQLGAQHSSPGSPSAAPAAAAGEEDERAQLERIIRLRRELEQEQEQEQRKKEELQTWGCAVCTFRNKLGVVKCEMCGMTRPGYASVAAPAAPSPASSSVAAAAASAPLVRAGVTAWQCGMCLAPNDASAERCKVCYAYRSSGTPVPTTSGGGGVTGVVSNTPFTTRWRCSVCGEVNAPANARCRICHGYQRNGTPVADEGGAGNGSSSGVGGGGSASVANAASGGDPPLPTTWACSVCTFENPTSAALCTACESGQRPRHLAPKREKEKPHASGAQRGEKTSSDDKKQWPCPTCTFLNPMGRRKCDMCGAKRPEKYAAAADTAEARADARREAQDDEEEVAWQDDDSVTECNNCHTTFTFLTRRHHCRLCGYVFCAHCSSYMLSLTEGGFPQRVCVNCYKARKEAENPGRSGVENALRSRLRVGR
jgi:hypothetical protein